MGYLYFWVLTIYYCDHFIIFECAMCLKSQPISTYVLNYKLICRLAWTHVVNHIVEVAVPNISCWVVPLRSQHTYNNVYLLKDLNLAQRFISKVQSLDILSCCFTECSSWMYIKFNLINYWCIICPFFPSSICGI